MSANRKQKPSHVMSSASGELSDLLLTPRERSIDVVEWIKKVDEKNKKPVITIEAQQTGTAAPNQQMTTAPNQQNGTQQTVYPSISGRQPMSEMERFLQENEKLMMIAGAVIGLVVLMLVIKKLKKK